MGFGGVVGVVENKAISAQPTELGVGLSWAELGNKIVWTGFLFTDYISSDLNIKGLFMYYAISIGGG